MITIVDEPFFETGRLSRDYTASTVRVLSITKYFPTPLRPTAPPDMSIRVMVTTDPVLISLYGPILVSYSVRFGHLLKPTPLLLAGLDDITSMGYTLEEFIVRLAFVGYKLVGAELERALDFRRRPAAYLSSVPGGPARDLVRKITRHRYADPERVWIARVNRNTVSATVRRADEKLGIAVDAEFRARRGSFHAKIMVRHWGDRVVWERGWLAREWSVNPFALAFAVLSHPSIEVVRRVVEGAARSRWPPGRVYRELCTDEGWYDDDIHDVLELVIDHEWVVAGAFEDGTKYVCVRLADHNKYVAIGLSNDGTVDAYDDSGRFSLAAPWLASHPPSTRDPKTRRRDVEQSLRMLKECGLLDEVMDAAPEVMAAALLLS